jgi:hypothetical protein
MKRGPKQLPRAERFWARVDKSDGCWLWTGSQFRLRGGYGSFYDDNGQLRRAHRVAMELELGRRLDPSECVCHTCDIPACVRPAHLFLGDQAENLRDMRSKGRGYAFAAADHEAAHVAQKLSNKMGRWRDTR